jgi:hypothetical protein
MLSIAERVEKWNCLYVRNNSGNNATVVVNFRVAGRPPYTLYIPPGNFPYQIYPGRVPKNALLEANDELQRFLDSGALQVIPGKPAREILANPEVRAEMQARLRRANNRHEQTQAAAAEMAGGQTPIAHVAGQPPVSPRVARVLQVKSPIEELTERTSTSPGGRSAYQFATAGTDGVQAKVLALAAGYLPEMDSQVVNQLKSMASMLTIADLNFMLQKMTSGQTHEWIRERLAKVTGSK